MERLLGKAVGTADAAGGGVTAVPIIAAHGGDFDVFACAWGVDEAVVANEHADMGNAVARSAEKHQVAWFEGTAFNVLANGGHGCRCAR